MAASDTQQDKENDEYATTLADRFLRDEPLKTLVLRGHLITESFLEDIIRRNMREGQRIARESRFSYWHKLKIVSALGVVSDNTIAALDALNGLRNACAHKIDRDVTGEDVEHIGRHVHDFESVKIKAAGNLGMLLVGVIATVAGALSSVAHPSKEGQYS
jgi:hypothetical protein